MKKPHNQTITRLFVVPLAFDPAKFWPEGGTDEHTERFFNKLLGLPSTRLPGDLRRQHRENSPGVTKNPSPTPSDHPIAC